MKKFIYLLFALLALAAVASCGKDDADGDVVGLGHETITTGAARDVSITTAVVDGNLRVTDDVLRDCTFGVIYSTQPGLDIDHCTGQQTSRSLEGQRFTVTLTGLRPDTKYYYRAFVCIGSNYVYGAEKTFTTKQAPSHHGHEYVDLGLPSGTLWATCNVGASSPEEYGDYFAWGEVEPKDYYKWSTYFDSVNGSSSNFKKYYNDGGKTELDPEDDAAYMNWGEGWRMPSRAQQDELRDTNNCTWQWTTQNGNNGCLVTSKKNGSSLFLPAAGFRDYGSLYYDGSWGYYWSRSLGAGGSYGAYDLSFDSSRIDWYDYGRCCGRSVRPVRVSASE